MEHTEENYKNVYENLRKKDWAGVGTERITLRKGRNNTYLNPDTWPTEHTVSIIRLA